MKCFLEILINGHNINVLNLFIIHKLAKMLRNNW